MKVLLSAYACEPGKGSEPGVGWRWACGLAEMVSLTVLTRENNRRAIEEVINSSRPSSSVRGVQFLYHDLHPFFLWLKRRRLLPTIAYYILWQHSVSRRFREVADGADIVHHLTLCTLLCPGFWNLSRASYVLGPVGAPEVDPRYLSLFGPSAWLQRLRGWVLSNAVDLPWIKRLLDSAKAVVPANTSTRDLLASHGIRAEEVMLDTGAPDVEWKDVPAEQSSGPFRLVYAGLLERRKGLELSLKALGKVRQRSDLDWKFDLFGAGPDHERLSKLVSDLGIADRVHFHGRVPRDELVSQFFRSSAFLFSSIRDTSGSVNLEAMACGLPVICLSHQGVGDITTDACALRVLPGSIDDTLDGLADAIEKLAGDRELQMRLGHEARRRAIEDFSWDAKFDRMVGYYKEACE